jgi:hypothetical protein
MEKRLKSKVRTDCLACGWVHEWEVKGDTEEEIADEAYKSYKEHKATHTRCKNAPWRLEWGPVEIC